MNSNDWLLEREVEVGVERKEPSKELRFGLGILASKGDLFVQLDLFMLGKRDEANRQNTSISRRSK